MLVKCDLFLSVYMCIYTHILFFKRRKEREKLSEFSMIETRRNLCCNMDKHSAN